MPSMSGSMRSRTISDGGSLPAFSRASVPFAATPTSKPAFWRYIATNEAMFVLVLDDEDALTPGLGHALSDCGREGGALRAG